VVAARVRAIWVMRSSVPWRMALASSWARASCWGVSCGCDVGPPWRLVRWISGRAADPSLCVQRFHQLSRRPHRERDGRRFSLTGGQARTHDGETVVTATSRRRGFRDRCRTRERLTFRRGQKCRSGTNLRPRPAARADRPRDLPADPPQPDAGEGLSLRNLEPQRGRLDGPARHSRAKVRGPDSPPPGLCAASRRRTWPPRDADRANASDLRRTSCCGANFLSARSDRELARRVPAGPARHVLGGVWRDDAAARLRQDVAGTGLNRREGQTSLD
jgi:hypothetical protein